MVSETEKAGEKVSVLVQRFGSTIAPTVVKLIESYYSRIKSFEEVPIKIMNFCGTHEWTTVRYGIRALVPDGIDLVAGPGCPVCVTPGKIIEQIVRLSLEGVRVYTFGDAFRVPSTSLKSPRNLAEAKAIGADVRIVYSFYDAVRDSKNDGRESIFLGIGFETTAPSYAVPIFEGKVPKNLKLLSVLRLTPPIMRYTIKLYRERGLLPIRGVIAPGHVSVVTGASVWEFLPREFGIATVVSGFEGIDLLISIAEILRMILERKPGLYVEYRRAVKWDGNLTAKNYVSSVFEEVDAAWRGIGYVPRSGLMLRDKYRELDAYYQYGLRPPGPEDYVLTSAGRTLEAELPPSCRCSEVVLGIAKPSQCPMFMKGCRPERPYGPCMVSQEGACYIWAKYGGADLLGSIKKIKQSGNSLYL